MKTLLVTLCLFFFVGADVVAGESKMAVTMLCNMMPFMNACVARDECAAGGALHAFNATSPVCDARVQLVHTCKHDAGMENMTPCKTYNVTVDAIVALGLADPLQAMPSSMTVNSAATDLCALESGQPALCAECSGSACPAFRVVAQYCAAAEANAAAAASCSGWQQFCCGAVAAGGAGGHDDGDGHAHKRNVPSDHAVKAMCFPGPAATVDNAMTFCSAIAATGGESAAASFGVFALISTTFLVLI